MPTAEQALQALLDGNRRYATGRTLQPHPHRSAHRRVETAAGQQPFAAILACADSRAAPEIIFDQGIGDIFVVRTAGQAIDAMGLGSLEYAAGYLHVPLIMVLGHSACGAVQAALAGGQEIPGQLQQILNAIQPAVQFARQQTGDLLANAIQANIARLVDQLRAAEPVLAEAVKRGSLRIVGALHTLESGQVTITVP